MTINPLGSINDPVLRPLIDARCENDRQRVTLRLVRRPRNIAEGKADAIGSFGDFVARPTYNAVYDFLRTRFPASAS